VNTIITTTKSALRTRMQDDFEQLAPRGETYLYVDRLFDESVTHRLKRQGGLPGRRARGSGGYGKPDDIDVLQYRYRLAHPDEYPPHVPRYPDVSMVDEFFYSIDPFTGVESVVSAPGKIVEKLTYLSMPGGALRCHVHRDACHTVGCTCGKPYCSEQADDPSINCGSH
jgi:hypothetical protein